MKTHLQNSTLAMILFVFLCGIWLMPSAEAFAQRKSGHKKHPNQQPAPTTEAVDPNLVAGITEALEQLKYELVGINAIVDNPIDESERRSLQKRLDKVQEETRLLERLIRRHIASVTSIPLTPVIVPVPAEPQPVVIVQEPVPQGPMPMPSEEFSEMVGQMRNASFSSEQMTILQTAIGNHYLSTEQASDILQVFSFSSDKLEAANIVVRRLVDLNQAFHLLKLMDFSSDKEKLKQIIDNAKKNR